MVRQAIAATFAVAVAINCASILVCEGVQAIHAVNRNKILGKLLGVYAVPGAALVAGLFAKRRAAARGGSLESWGALGLCGLWNLLLVWGCLRFLNICLTPGSSGGTQDLLDYLEMVSKGAAVVVAAITYFFAKAE